MHILPAEERRRSKSKSKRHSRRHRSDSGSEEPEDEEVVVQRAREVIWALNPMADTVAPVRSKFRRSARKSPPPSCT
jgi:hypothetical protein